MRATPSRLLATTAVVALAAMLGACAQPQPEATTAPDRPQSTPSASATPTTEPIATKPTATERAGTGVATPPATVELVDFETQNGTMRMRIPADWTVENNSAIAVQGDGHQGWNNELWFAAPDGGGIGYSDGHWDSVGAAAIETVVTEQIPVGSGLSAAAWWQRYEGDSYGVGVAIVPSLEEPSHVFRLGDGSRLRSLAFHHPGVEQAFASREAAEAYLSSPSVALALDVMATVEFAGDEDALPEGVGVEHEGTTYLPYTTRNGTASFLVPREWTVNDTSRLGTNRAGQEVWENSVTLEWLHVGPMLHYGDSEFTNIIEEWEWTRGEVRPTATDGWQAVSWALGDSVPNRGGRVGVSLTDRGGTVRPADTVCSERMCRSFASLPTPPHWYREAGVDGPEDFFGSAMEERLLTVVASLETHHEDPTRMPPLGG